MHCDDDGTDRKSGERNASPSDVSPPEKDTGVGAHSPQPPSSPTIKRAGHGVPRAALENVRALSKALNGNREFFKGGHFDALKNIRTIERSLGGQSLVELVNATSRSVSIVETMERSTRGWSTLLDDIKTAIAMPDFGSITRFNEAGDVSRLITTIQPDSTLRSILDTTRSISQPLGAAQWLSDINKFTRDIGKLQADLRSAWAPVTQLLDDLRRNQVDFASLTNRSMTSLVAASLAASAPYNDVPTSTLEMLAVTSAAIEASPTPELWNNVRQHSVLVETLSSLREAESAPFGGEEFGRALERLGDRFEAAIANAPQQSQKVAYWGLLLSVISIILTIVTILQAEGARERDVAKPDMTPAVVELLTKEGQTLNTIAERLAGELAATDKIVALRGANIRKAPTTSSKAIGRMQAGDIAVAHETASGWTKVELADPLTGNVTIGWIYSRLVAKVD